MLLAESLTEPVIGLAIEVHRNTGLGQLAASPRHVRRKINRSKSLCNGTVLIPTINEARVTAERAEMPWIRPSVGAGRVSRFIDSGY
jgi:hypothetical protein